MGNPTRACPDCGADISHRHHNAKYCEPCGTAREKVTQNKGERSKPCEVDDAECVPGRLRSGLCELHYRRKKKTGSTDATVTPTFQRYTLTETGCWRWTGGLFPNGYGKLGSSVHGTSLAHRAFFVEFRSPVADGLDLDHLCRNRACVNPEHLDPVTRSVNIQRGADARLAERGHLCGKGHDLALPGAVRKGKPGTQCTECWRIAYRAAGARYRAKQRGK